MSSKIIALLLLLSSSSLAYSQGIKTKIRQGNRLYKERNFSEAETAYRKALLLDSLSGKANFGVSAAAYELGRYKEAASYLERALRDPRISTKEAAATLHNLDNVAMKDKKYEEAIRLYEESLITHPESDDTRYNLALAQRLLKQQQQNQQDTRPAKSDSTAEKPDVCAQNPNSLMCAPMGNTDYQDLVLPQQNINIALSPLHIFNTDAACPAPTSFSIAGTQQRMSYEPMCDTARKARPFVIMMAMTAAFLMVFSALNRR